MTHNRQRHEAGKKNGSVVKRNEGEKKGRRMEGCSTHGQRV